VGIHQERRVLIQRMIRCVGTVALVLGTVVTAGAQAATRTPPAQPVVQEARVSKTAASITATSRVPGSRLMSIGLGQVMGKLAYTAFVQVPGKPGRTEIVVDATTGVVLLKRP
jgi:uncharacterized membrane protein YkoI